MCVCVIIVLLHVEVLVDIARACLFFPSLGSHCMCVIHVGGRVAGNICTYLVCICVLCILVNILWYFNTLCPVPLAWLPCIFFSSLFLQAGQRSGNLNQAVTEP